MSCHGANGDVAIASVDVREIVETTYVDQLRRSGEPVLHHRDERMPTGEELRLVAVFPKKLNGMFCRLGDRVIECCRNHAAPPFELIASQILCGVAGINMSVTP